MRKGWTFDLDAGFSGPKLVYSAADSEIVVVTSFKGTVLALDAATGKLLPGGIEKPPSSPRLLPLTGSSFAVVSPDASNKIQVVDLKTGQSKTVPVPVVPKSLAYQFVSPNMRYVVAVGIANSNDPAPFKLMSVDGNIILNFRWVRGNVYFTADSSRVLIAEGSGRCQWYKLPSGEKDGDEWKLLAGKPISLGAVSVLSACSADGSVLLYDGRLEGERGTHHILDGRTGQVVRSVQKTYAPQSASLSADGSLLFLPKREASQKIRSAEVFHIATGKVVADLSAFDSDSMVVSILPDGSGAIAVITPQNKVVRFDFVVPKP